MTTRFRRPVRSGVALQIARRVSGARFVWTNIAAPNRYRPLIEHIGSWFLIGRTPGDIFRLCDEADVPLDAVSMELDQTGLTHIVTISRLG